MHHPPQADTENTADNVTKKIFEILCELCDSVVNNIQL